MKTVIAAKTQLLISLSRDDLTALVNCANEVLSNSTVDEHDCHTRIGIDHPKLKNLLSDLITAVDSDVAQAAEIFDAWRDGASIQIRASSAFGDPADLGFDEVRKKLQPILDDEKNA